MNKRGLGKGLDALFGETSGTLVKGSLGDEPTQKDIREIDIKKIAPNKFQPRRVFDKAQLLELAESIKEVGVIQPVVVRKTKTGYELVYGERRWRASGVAGLKVIPAIVREYTDSQMLQIALIENIQRQELNPLEEAQAYRRLMDDFSMTQLELSQKVGRSRSVIANSVRLLNLHPDIQKFILEGALTMGQAKPLLAIEDSNLQLDAAIRIISEGYSARDAEEMVKAMLASPPYHGAEPLEEVAVSAKKQDYGMLGGQAYAEEYEDRLRLMLGTKVKIKPGKVKSKIEIEFYSSEDLERILEAFGERKQRPSGYVGGKELVV